MTAVRDRPRRRARETKRLEDQPTGRVRDATDEALPYRGGARQIPDQYFWWLADHCGEFVGMCDANAVPLYVNAAGLHLVGLDDKDAFIATLAHELRQPVAAMLPALAMMRERAARR